MPDDTPMNEPNAKVKTTADRRLAASKEGTERQRIASPSLLRLDVQ
jgi:hypothetical protein